MSNLSKRTVMLVAAIVLNACHTPHTEVLSEPVADDDDSGLYEAHCDGKRATIGDCYKEARQYCGGAIEVVDKDGSERIVNAGGTLITKAKRSLVYRCK